MSTTAFANARELKDIATLLDSIQRIATRPGNQRLSVVMGTVAIQNTEGVIVGYAEPENGVYSFKTVSEHVEQREDDPSLHTGALTVITPEMMGQHDALASRDLPADEPEMAATVPMDEMRENREPMPGNGSHAAHA